MRRSLLIASALLSISFVSLASAADLPLKVAPMLSPFDVGGAGFYWGVGAESTVEQASTSGNALFATSLINGNLTASGGSVYGAIGYINGGLGRWYRVQATLGYSNITGSSTVAGSVASRWSATQEFDVGFELISRIFAALPNLGVTFPSFTPQLPANIAVAAAPRQYVGVGFREFGLDGSFGSANGSTWSVAPMLTTGYIFQMLDASGKPTGSVIDLSVYVAKPMRGLTVSGVGAFGGPGLAFSGGADLGTMYGARMSVDFSL